MGHDPVFGFFGVIIVVLGIIYSIILIVIPFVIISINNKLKDTNTLLKNILTALSTRWEIEQKKQTTCAACGSTLPPGVTTCPKCGQGHRTP